MNGPNRHQRTVHFRTRPSEAEPGVFRRIAARIYPAQDELAIYTMAISISVLAIVDTEFRVLLSNGLYQFLVGIPKEAFITSKSEGAMLFLGGISLAITSFASLVASFVLPFTQRRFDNLVRLILMAHLIIIVVSHFVVLENGGNPINSLLALGFLLYFAGFCFCARYRLIKEFVANRQSTSREAIVAGMFATVSIVICSFGLDWHWASCYAFAAINAVFVTRIVVKMA